VRLDEEVALTDQYNDLLAVMRVEEIYEWDRGVEARAVCGTEDVRHPLVAEMRGWGSRYASGALRVLALPRHDDFKRLRMTPFEVRERLMSLGRTNVVAFQTRNPLHRVHEELTVRAAASIGGDAAAAPFGRDDEAGRHRPLRARSYLSGVDVAALRCVALSARAAAAGDAHGGAA
jgi:sulfate adenylyltransferase